MSDLVLDKYYVLLLMCLFRNSYFSIAERRAKGLIPDTISSNVEKCLIYCELARIKTCLHSVGSINFSKL